jgi:formylglycine-generating enzyme required for sulfatase activity
MKNPVEDKKKSPIRVFRGGSWFYYARGTRVSYRYFYSPDNRDFDFGFRLVKNGKKSE